MIPPGARYANLLARLDLARQTGVSLGLDRTRAVLARLGHPERRAVTVQIAGTNGKGSTAAMTDAILRAAGISVGLYTSPHLCRFTERIRINGRESDGDRLAVLDQAIAATGVPLTYFEIATVLAFLMFAASSVDVVVLETGLGGRLDATTACDPIATAITSVAIDHAELLGSTLDAIAREKAGIAKADVPLFLAPVSAEADTAIAAVARAAGARLLRFGRDFPPPPVLPALGGAHQKTNAAVAVALARKAAETLGRPLTDQAIEAGLQGVSWPGRLEWIGDRILLDCAHNAEGAEALAGSIGRLPAQRRALVFSVVFGKPASVMLATLAPWVDAIFLTRSSSDRSLTTAALALLVPRDCQAQLFSIPEPAAALAAALDFVGSAGLVIAAGSTFLVGDLRTLLLGESRDSLPTSDPISPPPP